MLMSLGGIVFGVGFFIVTQAQVSGFQEFFIETILGTEGAVKITDRYQDTLSSVRATRADGAPTTFFYADKANTRFVEGVEYPDELIESLKTLENFESASPVLVGNMQIASPLRKESGQVYGIDLDAHLSVTNLEDQMRIGSLDVFRETPTGIVIGMKMKERLRANIGESLIVRMLDQTRRYKVVGVFETGVSEIDEGRAFMHLQEARSMMKEPHGVTFVQVQVKDRDLAPLDAEAIRRLTNHAAASWQEREKTWLGVFRALQISAAITVSTIILISGLGMFNTLVMIVMEKTREIAILRSMGYTRRDIMNVFFLQGALVLVVGTLIGFALGAGVTYAISKMKIDIRGIFTADTYIVNWSAMHYLYAALTAAVIVMFASLAPARRAARLIPGDVIRGTST
ncbi:MAG: ABC transporter permease [Symploca sp. SIO2D2]|nr:ABC transporter permease [Symploca sp. SIO2D2]